MELSKDFIELMTSALGREQAELLFQALETSPEISIRQNRVKCQEYDRCCGMVLSERVPWASDAWYLPERPSFILDPQFHAGTYYVQEASSMFLEQALKTVVKGPVKALDLCAAPGGKSTHLCQLLPEGSVIVSNEINRTRARILAENIVKWGRPASVVTSNSPKQIGQSGLRFDLMVVDAPCSGEGMFRKDPVAVQEWSLANVEMCAQRQREIITDVWPALKPGGYLIYSTCTFNTTEDEGIVRWLIEEMGAEPVSIPAQAEWGITGSLVPDLEAPVYHFMQHRTRGEGFFMALLRKPQDELTEPVQRVFRLRKDPVPSDMKTWLQGDFVFENEGDAICAYPSGQSDFMHQVSASLFALVKGVQIGRMKGRDIIPAHALSMCQALDASRFERVEITERQAVDYLHGDAIQTPDAPRGIVLLCFNGVPLGFAKNLGNRANNLYPEEWRIRKSVV